MSIDPLIRVLETERDPYMEWHDGPTLGEVDSAMSNLTADERMTASRIVAERIRRSYDPYLGRAAEILNTEECRSALAEILSAGPDRATTSNVARNLLQIGQSEEAITALQGIIENRSLWWGDRINALVNLKIAMTAAGNNRPISDFITPEFESVIFEAISDNDYLVRYHAADALLKAAGDHKDLSAHEEIFSLICGKRSSDGMPDEVDREGFREAARLLRLHLEK